MVAIDSITAAAKIDPSLLPDGASMYSRLIYSSSGQRESAPKRHGSSTL